MVVISFIIQMGQPLFWLTISPADIHSPIVMMMAGVRLDVTSQLKPTSPTTPTNCDWLPQTPFPLPSFTTL